MMIEILQSPCDADECGSPSLFTSFSLSFFNESVTSSAAYLSLSRAAATYVIKLQLIVSELRG